MRRFIIAVLDSVGCGALPDAADYNSAGADTLGHVAASRPLALPNLQRLGLGNIRPLAHIAPEAQPKAAFGKMAAASAGMDTTSGHWEIAGLLLDQRLPTYPHGFPPEVIDAFTAAIGSGVLGNRAASGTAIINELGAEHLASKKPIVYTSADSVFQLAAHEELYAPEKLYDMCRAAREILQGPHAVGRVIARPFVGNVRDGFRRTGNRRDFSLPPPPRGLLEAVHKAKLPVVSIGKINDIFAGRDITDRLTAHSNDESMSALIKALGEFDRGLIFANFVDFDMLYGHRNDVEGYAQALERFDAGLADVLPLLGTEDVLAITADHGNDPATPGSDHNREYAPLLVVGPRVKPAALGIRATFADLGQTAAEYLGAAKLPAGTSFLNDIGGVSQ